MMGRISSIIIGLALIIAVSCVPYMSVLGSVGSGIYFVWEGELSGLHAGIKTHYWCVRHRLEIVEWEMDTNLSVQAKVTTEYWKVSMYSERVANASRTVTVSFPKSAPFYSICEENWGFRMYFIFTPFVIFNTKLEDFPKYLEREFIDGGYINQQGKYGLLYDTWNIELGSYRDIYYMELYYQALLLNWGEPVDPDTGLGNTSVMEIDVRIDKELGIVLGVRFFWMYRHIYHEIKINLVDTNAFPKYRFIIGVVGGIIGLIVLGIIIRSYKARRRRRLIRV